MSNHGIADIIFDRKDFEAYEPAPLSDEDYEIIKKQLNCSTNVRDAMCAGLRTLCRYSCAVSENMDIDSSELNDLSWITRHLTDELEAVTTLGNILNFRIELAYLHSQGKKYEVNLK